MTRPSERIGPASRRRQVLWLLGLILLVAALVILGTVWRPHATVVEMTLRVSEADIVVVPDPETERSCELFERPVAVRHLGLSKVRAIEATLAEKGRVTLRPGDQGTVRISADGSPFALSVQLEGSTRLTAELAGVDRRKGSGRRIRITLAPGVSGRDETWRAEVEPQTDLVLDAADVEISTADATAAFQVDDEHYRVPASSQKILVSGGPEESVINLTLEPKRRAATEVRVLDPATGAWSEVKRHEGYVVAEPRVVAWKDQLVLLDPNPGDRLPSRPFKRDLRVNRLRLWRGVGHEAESHLVSGEVRFLEGKREPLALDPGLFLRVKLPPGGVLNLRSIERIDEDLVMVVRGRVNELQLGPDPQLLRRVSPSWFEFLYSHQFAGLIYGALAWVVAASLALLKFLGLLEK